MIGKHIEALLGYLRDATATHSGVYHATNDELRAIDEAEMSGIASDEEVIAAFAAFGSD